MKKNKNKRKRKIIISILLILVIIVGTYIYNNSQTDDFYDAVIVKRQIKEDAKGYIILNEKVIAYDNTKSFIPMVDEGKRIGKTEVVGVYKDEEYEKINKEIIKIDEEIKTSLSKIPLVYSNDILDMQEEINEKAKQASNYNSYTDINSLKLSLDALSYKKALSTAKASTNGEVIKKLIDKRNDCLEKLENSKSNIVANENGIIKYSIDSLENTKKEDYTLKNVNDIISSYDNLNNSKFGIKIIDNYNADIIFKLDKENKKLLNKDRYYTIVISQTNEKISVKLNKILEDENNIYCIFHTNEKIEQLISKRNINFKLILKDITGFFVNKNSIKKVDEIYYLTIISFNEYIDIPVKIIYEYTGNYIVDNYSKEEKKLLGLEKTNNLIRYDRIAN